MEIHHKLIQECIMQILELETVRRSTFRFPVKLLVPGGCSLQLVMSLSFPFATMWMDTGF